MGHKVVTVVAKFVCHDDWSADKIITHALAESDGVPCTIDVTETEAVHTPAPTFMGADCIDCDHEELSDVSLLYPDEQVCPCRACSYRNVCCVNMSVATRANCSRYQDFLKSL